MTKNSYKKSYRSVETYLHSLNIFMTWPHSDQVIWSNSRQTTLDNAHNKDEIDPLSQDVAILTS